MGMLKKNKSHEAKDRFKELEKRFDLKDLEKKFGKIDLKELEKRLDFKELEKKLDFDTDLAKRYREMRLPRSQEEPESSSAGFIAGLVVGAIVGVVLAIIFGKKNNGELMDDFAHRTGTLRDTAAGTYQQVRGDAAGQTGPVAGRFGDDVAIEREINGDVDPVESARDTIDSASEDIQDSVEDVQDTDQDLAGDTERRFGQV